MLATNDLLNKVKFRVWDDCVPNTNKIQKTVKTSQNVLHSPITLKANKNAIGKLWLVAWWVVVIRSGSKKLPRPTASSRATKNSHDWKQATYTGSWSLTRRDHLSGTSAWAKLPPPAKTSLWVRVPYVPR